MKLIESKLKCFLTLRRTVYENLKTKVARFDHKVAKWDFWGSFSNTLLPALRILFWWITIKYSTKKHKNLNPREVKRSFDIQLTNITKKQQLFVAMLTNEVCVHTLWRMYDNTAIWPFFRLLYNAQCVGRNYNVTFYDHSSSARKLPLPNFAQRKITIEKKKEKL